MKSSPPPPPPYRVHPGLRRHFHRRLRPPAGSRPPNPAPYRLPPPRDPANALRTNRPAAALIPRAPDCPGPARAPGAPSCRAPPALPCRASCPVPAKAGAPMPRLVLPQPACDRVLFRWRPSKVTGSSQRTTARHVGATASASLPPPAAPFNPRPRQRNGLHRQWLVGALRLPAAGRLRPSFPQRQPRRGVALVFLCALCFSAVEVRFCFSLLTVNLQLLTPNSETHTNDLSSTFVLNLNGPSGLSTPPLPTGILSRVRGSPKRLECLHLHHPNAHERPAPPPAAPPFSSRNLDPKSFTTISLMASINASFLTSAPRGSIDARIGVV